MRSMLGTALAFLGAVALAGASTAATTSFPIDPSPGALGQRNAIAIGADGFPLVSYIAGDPQGGGNLRVTKCGAVDCSTGNVSTTLTAGGGVVANLGLVVPDDGRPLLAYIQYDGVALNVRVTRCGNAACTQDDSTQTLPGLASPNHFSGGLVLAGDDRPLVAYMPQSGVIRLVKCQDLDCMSSSNVLAPLAGADAFRLAIGTAGTPLIGARSGGVLWIGRCHDGTCATAPSFATAIEDVDGAFSLLDGPDAKPYVVRQKDGTVSVIRCELGDCEGGQPGLRHVNAISAGGTKYAIAVGSVGGSPLVAFQEGGLKVAQCGSLTCARDTTLTVIDDRTSLGDLSIVFGLDGHPVIAYYDAITQDIYVARCGNATCQDASAVRVIGQSGEPLAFVTAFAEARVDLVDTVSRRVVSQIDVPPGPTGVAFSPDGRKAYVTGISSGTVSSIDVASRSVEGTVAVGYVSQPRGIAVAPDHARIYVALGGTNEIAVIDRAAGDVLSLVPAGAQPFGIALAPNGNVGVVANTAGNNVTFFSANVALGTVPVGQQPYGVAVDPAGQFAYVANFASNSVSVLDVGARAVVGTIPVGTGPFGVAVNRDGTRLYVSDNQDRVSVVDTATRTVIASVPVGSHPQGVALTPDDTQLYVANQFSDDVTVIDTGTNTPSGDPIRVAGQPLSLGAFVSPPLGTIRAVEYLHASFGHYFVTAIPGEIQALDAGTFDGWARTGEAFDVYETDAGHADVCRFFTVAFAPKSSHFYTPLVNECEIVKTNPDWIYEGIVFEVRLPSGATCPVGTTPLYRLYNDGKGGAPNHRYTTKTSIRDQMVAAGFVFEGATGCVPK